MLPAPSVQSAPVRPYSLKAVVRVQVQRRYLKADVAVLHMPKGGLIVAMLAAIVLGALELTLGFLTVPHEYGHVWAARMVGHRVAIIQVRHHFFVLTGPKLHHAVL